MNKYLLWAGTIFIVLLSGCGHKPVVPVTPTEVLVPIPTKCTVEWPTKPETIKFDALPTSLFDRATLIIRENEECRRYSRELEILLRSCTK